MHARAHAHPPCSLARRPRAALRTACRSRGAGGPPAGRRWRAARRGPTCHVWGRAAGRTPPHTARAPAYARASRGASRCSTCATSPRRRPWAAAATPPARRELLSQPKPPKPGRHRSRYDPGQHSGSQLRCGLGQPPPQAARRPPLPPLRSVLAVAHNISNAHTAPADGHSAAAPYARRLGARCGAGAGSNCLAAIGAASRARPRTRGAARRPAGPRGGAASLPPPGGPTAPRAMGVL